MQIALKPAVQEFIDKEVQAGRFQSPGEVLDEALNRMMDDGLVAPDDQTLATIDESEDQIERGQYRAWKVESARLRAKYLAK